MEFIRFFTQEAAAFPQYPRWIYWLAVIICLAGTQLIKLPLKHFTKKLPEKTRIRVNTVIIAIPEAIGLIISAVLIAFKYEFSVMAAMSWGATSQLVYIFLIKVYNRIKGGEPITVDTLNEDFKEAYNENVTANDKFSNMCDDIKNFK